MNTMLKDIHITDFRGIKELRVTEFSKFNVFIGRNASGKTTLLEAISVAANQVVPNGW
jgi:DNA replication and repair protein RecF